MPDGAWRTGRSSSFEAQAAAREQARMQQSFETGHTASDSLTAKASVDGDTRAAGLHPDTGNGASTLPGMICSLRHGNAREHGVNRHSLFLGD